MLLQLVCSLKIRKKAFCWFRFCHAVYVYNLLNAECSISCPCLRRSHQNNDSIRKSAPFDRCYLLDLAECPRTLRTAKETSFRRLQLEREAV
jgi:hypothetical protein